jgi:hypothetical protein
VLRTDATAGGNRLAWHPHPLQPSPPPSPNSVTLGHRTRRGQLVTLGDR